MGIAWLIPPFIGGFFMACSTTSEASTESSPAKDETFLGHTELNQPVR